VQPLRVCELSDDSIGGSLLTSAVPVVLARDDNETDDEYLTVVRFALVVAAA
jgi:hypothetical protein